MELFGLLFLVWAVVSIMSTVTVFSINEKVDKILKKFNDNVNDDTVIGMSSDGGNGFIDINGINQNPNNED